MGASRLPCRWHTIVLAAGGCWVSEKPTYGELERRVADLERQLGELRSESVKYRTFFHSFPHGISIADARGDILETNRVAEALLGVPMDEHVGRSIDGEEWRLIRPDGTDMPADEWASVIALREQRQVSDCEMGIVKPGGAVTWLNVTAAPLPPDGQGVVITYSDITERKEFERSLDEARRRNQILLETIPDLMFVLSDDGRILDFQANDRSELVLDPQDVVGSLLSDSMPAAVVDRIRAAVTACLEEGTLQVVEFELTVKKGAQHFEARIMPLSETSVLSIVRNISRRKLAERRRRLYETIVSSASEPMAVIDTEYRFRLVNDAYESFWDTDRSEILGRQVAEIMGREAFERTVKANVDRCLAGQDVRYGAWFDSPTRGRRFMDLNYYPLRGAGGEVEGLINLAYDNTERVVMEQQLKESEARQRSLFEYAPDAVYLADLQGRFLDVNKAAEKQTGYTRAQLLEMSVEDLDDRARLEQDRSNIWAKLRPGRPVLVNTAHRRMDGSPYPVEVHVSLLENDDEGILLGICRDVSEKQEMEARLRQAQKMEAIGTLAGGIAHDFNNILTAMIGFTEIALEDTAKDSPLKESLQEVLTAGMRARDLVNQILAFARQSGEDVGPVQPSSIAREVLKFMRSSIPATIEIRQRIDSRAAVLGNTTQIYQALLNLCTNAAQAMEDTGGVLDLGIEEVAFTGRVGEGEPDLPPGKYVEIRISDTGHGIAADVADSIFEPYFTTKAPGEGTGMGLAMVHGIVESYGGAVTVQSVPGQGACFTVLLPVTSERTSLDASRGADLPAGSERILYVDDEPSITMMGRRILERLGYSVTTFSSSVEALEAFRDRPDAFDLVISDLTMPKMTGDVLAGELMAIRPDIPIVLCTGFSKRMTMEAAAEIGIRAFAYKPITREVLARTVRDVLDGAGGTGGGRRRR